MDCIASGDESSGAGADGNWVYAMAFPLVRVDLADTVRAGLRALLPPGASYLHFYDLTPKRRTEVARGLAMLPWEAALIVSRLTTGRRQEQARTRILTHALPRLQHHERVRRLLLESRARADRRDASLVLRLRGSRSITHELFISHVPKTSDELTWLADFIVGAFVAGQVRGNSEAWAILEEACVLDTVWLPPDLP